MNFRDERLLDLRLALLRLLAEAGDEGANSFILARAVDELGFNVTRDSVRAELAWLKEQRLVALFETGGPAVASLTERGHDVARGRTVNHGVRQYVPGAGV